MKTLGVFIFFISCALCIFYYNGDKEAFIKRPEIIKTAITKIKRVIINNVKENNGEVKSKIDVESKKIQSISDFSNDQIEDEILQIDRDIEENEFIRKANLNELSKDDRDYFVSMLRKRDKFYKEKIHRTLAKFGY